MYKKILLLTGIILVFNINCQKKDEGENKTSFLQFEVVKVHFEQNVTDGDLEVVFEVKAGDEGLLKLEVIAPDGRTIINSTSPDATTLGIRQFRFESPEPKDMEGLKAAYPEGRYKFSGITTNDEKYENTVILSHKLPSTITFLYPQPEAENVNIEGLIIKWSPVKDAVSYIIEIEQDDLNFSMTANISGSYSEFIVPETILVANKEYTLGIGSVSEDGNSSFVETSFTTAE